MLLLHTIRWIVLRLGWRAGWLLLVPITAWFYATSAAAKAASRAYLSRALERPVRRADVFAHLFSFGAVIMDRVLLAAGRAGRFRITVVGLENLRGIIDGGRGCVLLGAHLGSFEVLRCLARQAPVAVRPVMYRRNAGTLTRVIEQLDPELAARVIELGSLSAVLQLRDCVQAGEIAGVLADRAPAGQQMVGAPFLGARAAFPAGPFLLAAGLGVPVMLCCGLRTGQRRYEIRFEPFADPLALPGGRHSAALSACVARYAAWLEAACLAHPFNWFNFYDFWEGGDEADTAAAAAGPRRTSSAA